MKYLSMLSLALLLAGCQLVPPSAQNNTEDLELATSSGIDGVYSGGSYSEPAGLNATYTPGSLASGGSYSPEPAAGYNAASNGDHYDNPNYGQNVVGGPKATAKDRIVYFAYDSSAIDSRAEAVVEEHATYLKAHPEVKILLEGHTDSRGSREYNIALGERRAISVLKRFKALGVPMKQIRVISYGEENPAVQGFTEAAYKRNRRAVIQY